MLSLQFKLHLFCFSFSFLLRFLCLFEVNFGLIELDAQIGYRLVHFRGRRFCFIFRILLLWLRLRCRLRLFDSCCLDKGLRGFIESTLFLLVDHLWLFCFFSTLVSTLLLFCRLKLCLLGSFKPGRNWSLLFNNSLCSIGYYHLSFLFLAA